MAKKPRKVTAHKKRDDQKFGNPFSRGKTEVDRYTMKDAAKYKNIFS